MSMSLNAATTMPVDRTASTPAPTWADVAGEFVASCTLRAPAGGLLRAPGVVGVLEGPAPVVWVYGDASVSHLRATLDRSPAVEDVYVDATRERLIGRLSELGWNVAEQVDQYVRPASAPVDLEEAALAIRTLGPDDLVAWRSFLLASGGLSPALAASAFPDNFFEVAGPVEVLGAFGPDGTLVGSVGRRNQRRSAMVFALAVDPEWRGRDVAATLVNAAARRAGNNGADFLHAQAGTAGSGVFARCGFSSVGRWQMLSRPATPDTSGSED